MLFSIFALTIITVWFMKSVINRTTLLIITLLMTISCGKNVDSRLVEFSIKDSSGTERECGVYLPKNYSKSKEYPVIYMLDGLVFKESGYKVLVDSLIDNRCISPVIIACSYENKEPVPGFRISYRNAEFVESISRQDPKLTELFENHYSFVTQDFINYIEKHYPVKKDPDGRIFYGTSNSADFGITLSFRDPSLIPEYWCFSPVNSNIEHYGMLEDNVTYRICWGVKEEVNQFDYFPSLVNSIRKRGGNVKSWVFESGHDRGYWRKWFGEELKRRFPCKVN